jgi:UDP-N-acetylmuramoyl-L-alanyl-D-glutamate--2,6-diaminopimelate ligase
LKSLSDHNNQGDVRLSALLTLDGIEVHGDAVIHGLTADSRAVQNGYLFAALPGTRADGKSFIADALSRGASAILADPITAAELAGRGIPVLASTNPRRALSLVAAKFYRRQPAVIAAVTGTNGKTSVARFTRQIWHMTGRSSASLGTLGIEADDLQRDLAHTTPDPVTLHAALAELFDHNVTHLALEASSHGLDQFRLDGLLVSAAALTNITRDHLDYHESFEAYAAAKMRLFTDIVDPDGAAVINVDGDGCARAVDLAWKRRLNLVTVGRKGSELKIISQRAEAQGQKLKIAWRGRPYDIALPLLGQFQASNALIAAALTISLGEDPDRVMASLEQLDGVPGRLERAATLPNGASVYVDYAHTPDALETILLALRPHARGRLVVVFGCGGDRDPGKRPMMGAIAARLADFSVVTDDNPRHEDPAAIRAAILAGLPGERVQEIADRAEAIGEAVRGLGPGDLLVIAGKGHETGQISGDSVRPFDDRQVAAEAAMAVAGGGNG